MQKTFVISLGGSLIVPEEYDSKFLFGFKALIERHVKKGSRFLIYCGGGSIARKIQNAASSVGKLEDGDIDWLGIHATRLNAQLIRTIFKDHAQEQIICDPRNFAFEKKIAIAAGWIPGWSTDFDAVIAAEKLGANLVINMSNIDYVYNKDPKKFKDARKIEKMSWDDLLLLTGKKWKPGLNAPFDPIAARKAREIGMKAVVIGKGLKNLSNLLEGKRFLGTVIG